MAELSTKKEQLMEHANRLSANDRLLEKLNQDSSIESQAFRQELDEKLKEQEVRLKAEMEAKSKEQEAQAKEREAVLKEDMRGEMQQMMRQCGFFPAAANTTDPTQQSPANEENSTSCKP